MIIGVGFQKTGTSTLRDALRILGYKVKDTSARALIPILKNDWNKVLRMLEGFDAVEDTPWYKVYKELDQHLPNSKFILTYREPESWYKSVSRHIGDLRDAQHEWIYGRGKGLPKDHKENTLKVYTDHITEVKEYFKDRPEDLLIIDFTKGDQWEPICTFLGLPIPNAPFPHANNASKLVDDRKSAKKRFKFFRKRVKSYIKIKYIDWKGLWS